MFNPSVFFEPTAAWIDWMVKYANGRVIFDIGCGQGHVTMALRNFGGKAIGFDPNFEYMGRSMCSAVIPKYFEDCNKSVIHIPNAVAIFCRPCHSGFVEECIDLLHPEAKALYISKPENVEIDFERYEVKELDAPSCPEEKTYEVIR